MIDPPIVAGVQGGVGTTLLARALHGYDARIYRPWSPVDVLVCRSTAHSVYAAQHALQHTRDKPVLAVVDDAPGASWGQNTANKIRLTEPYVQSWVRIPMVSDWRELESPSSFVATILETAEQDLPKSARQFARALLELVDEIVRLDSVDDQFRSA
ncbi:hypothetical protein [Pseudonocardia sp. NPDC049635]|uniref:hypothetical protein n=1 Tax=Pseudonocardia sp. NPDC049635 TaxID=3155506 RepID=UPI0033FBAC70